MSWLRNLELGCTAPPEAAVDVLASPPPEAMGSTPPLLLLLLLLLLLPLHELMQGLLLLVLLVLLLLREARTASRAGNRSVKVASLAMGRWRGMHDRIAPRERGRRGGGKMPSQHEQRFVSKHVDGKSLVLL